MARMKLCFRPLKRTVCTLALRMCHGARLHFFRTKHTLNIVLRRPLFGDCYDWLFLGLLRESRHSRILRVCESKSHSPLRLGRCTASSSLTRDGRLNDRYIKLRWWSEPLTRQKQCRRANWFRQGTEPYSGINGVAHQKTMQGSQNARKVHERIQRTVALIPRKKKIQKRDRADEFVEL